MCSMARASEERARMFIMKGKSNLDVFDRDYNAKAVKYIDE